MNNIAYNIDCMEYMRTLPVGEWQEYMENGVCRFEVISKRDITEEYYSKKIVSSREYWNPFTYEGGTLHKLTEKGGEL